MTLLQDRSKYSEEFIQYFTENMEKYLESALKDFNCKLNLGKGAFVLKIDINTDDDFDLDILDPKSTKEKNSVNADLFEHDENGCVCIYDDDQESLVKKAIKILEDAKFTFVKTWGITRGDVKETGDYSHAWYSIRNQAIDSLKNGETSLFFGGNQTISIEMSPTDLEQKNQKSAHRRCSF